MADPTPETLDDWHALIASATTPLTIRDAWCPPIELVRSRTEGTAAVLALASYVQRIGGAADRDEALRIVHVNLGYVAGYYGSGDALREVRQRVERYMGSVHPIFGRVVTPPARALETPIA